MSNYVPTFDRTYEFEGDKVTVTFGNMSREDAFELLQHAPDGVTPDSKPEDLDETQTSKAKDFAVYSIGYLPKYVKCMTGLLDAHGDAVPLEAVCTEAYFLNLAAQMATDMFKASFVHGEKEPEGKKSGPASGRSSGDLGTQGRDGLG